MEDYYSILEVDRNSSDKEIKAAYRKVAKKWHPDVNSDKAATKMFQKVNEAYSVLGSPERRALFDSGNYDEAIDPSTPATEAEFNPVVCDGCQAISAQPRFIQYGRVFSMLFFSFRTKPCGVFCVSCASKRLFWNSLLTGLFGWLSIWGFFWTIEVIIINLLGGTKNAAINAFVLGKQSAYFYHKGESNIAVKLAEDSINFFKKTSMSDPNFEIGKSGSQVSQNILQLSPKTNKRLKGCWTGWAKPNRLSMLAFSLPVIFIFIISGIQGKKSKHTGSPQKPIPPTSQFDPSSQGVTFVGRNGNKFRLSQQDAQKVTPNLNHLETIQKNLYVRGQKLKEMEKLIKQQEVSLYTDKEIYNFKNLFDKWDAENKKLKTDFESFTMLLETYYKELERLGAKLR